MTRAMWMFTFATLLPVPLIAGAAMLGGGWSWAAMLYMTALAMTLDEAIRIVTPAEDAGQEFPAADALSVALALCH